MIEALNALELELVLKFIDASPVEEGDRPGSVPVPVWLGFRDEDLLLMVAGCDGLDAPGTMVWCGRERS